MNSKRILTYLKSKARSKALANQYVSAADIRNVMRSQVEGSSRGGFVTKAFNDLLTEGFLEVTGAQEHNPATGHLVRLYTLSNW